LPLAWHEDKVTMKYLPAKAVDGLFSKKDLILSKKFDNFVKLWQPGTPAQSN
jgi:hypothetical protein